MHAEIVVPVLKSHLSSVDFGEVQRGEARLIAIQLENPSPIAVYWNKRTHRELPLDRLKLRGIGQIGCRADRKMNKFKQPPIFDVIPLCGVIQPGEKCNIQIKFAPLDQRRYEERVVLHVENAPEDLHIRCCGYGLEPQLEFDQTMLQFDPCLPYGPGEERIVTVSNPCNYPIEFYSLEMDPVAFEQDQILRSLDGYDQYGQLLLPPRKAGEGLPMEIVTYWEEQVKRNADLKEETNGNDELADTPQSPRPVFDQSVRIQSEELKKRRLTSTDFLATTLNPDSTPVTVGPRVMCDVTPVSLTNARYLGVDLSGGTRLSVKRQGIAIILHGPLTAIRKGVATCLASYYQATILNLDQIILDALATSLSGAAATVREFCAEAGRAVYLEACRIREAEMREVKQFDIAEIQEPDDDRKLSDATDIPNEALNQSEGTGGKPRRGNEVVGASVTVMHGLQHSDGEPASRALQGTKSVPRRTSHMSHGAVDARPSSPPSIGAPIPRRISLTGFSSTGAPLVEFDMEENITDSCEDEEPAELRENQLYSTVLPDDLVVTLLQERFAQEDCFKGIIVNGLESQFTESSQKTAQLVLRALEERQFIYAVTVRAELAYLKVLEEEMEAAQAMAKAAEETARRQRALQMDEFEYGLLTEEEKKTVDDLRTQERREIRHRELEAKRIREEKEREEREAEARRLELEKMNKRKGKKMEEKAPKQPTQPQIGEIKESRATPGRPMSRAMGEKEKSAKGPYGADHLEAGHLAAFDRFKSFAVEFQGICDLFSTWDRSTQTQRLITGFDDSNDQGFGSPNPLQTGALRRPKPGIQVKSKKSVVRSDTSRVDAPHMDSLLETSNPLPPIYCDHLPSLTGTDSIVSEQISAKPTVSERTSTVSKQTSRGLTGLGIPHLIVDAQLGATPDVIHDVKREVVETLSSVPVLRPFELSHETESWLPTYRDEDNKESPAFSLIAPHLPNAEEVLEHLGIGSSGPPIPTPVDFSVIQFPPARLPPRLDSSLSTSLQT
ncbi:unnamed protein product [Echinostoma caproni]|uniref:Hydin_ADK domain-containing protein n=1 Tax=Echinostoma caproni TaxID=27848 RepID=A0A3P8HHA6_9TREM|nr:unnamed protein product [Echinostoma caproni]